MAHRLGETLFPTIPVGSLPRPQWVRELVAERKAGRVSDSEADRLLDDAVPLAIRLQERAGLTVVSDGEWRRTHYATVFAECVDGFKPGLVPNAGARIAERRAAPARTGDPGVVSTIERKRPIAAREAEFLRKHTSQPIIVALPSPYTLAWRMWSAQHSASAYPTRESFMDAIIPIIRAEVLELVQLGVDAIQIDNPWPPIIIDPNLEESTSPMPTEWASASDDAAEDLVREAELCVKCVNGVTEGIDDVFLNLHVCHTRGHTTRESYGVIIRVLDQMHIDRFALEFATPEAGVTDALKDFPENKILGLGVIHPFDANVETPEQVADIAERAIEYVPKERISLNPNCGFAPGAGSGRRRTTGTNIPVDLDGAYLKLQAMSQGAELLRQRHG